MATDRRRVQRVTLRTPLRGEASGKRIFLLDVSLHGLRVTHQEELGPNGTPLDIVFEWEGQRVEVSGELRWTVRVAGKTASAKTLYRSGVLITRIDPLARQVLRNIVLDHVTRALDEQRANARGIPAAAAQSFQTGGGVELVRHDYVGGKWLETTTTDPRQPSTGFTIEASHSREEVLMLREAYAAGDRSSREMIREMAAASIASTGIPTRRYMP